MHRHVLILLVLLIRSSTVYAQDGAQKLYEAMEQKLSKAKAHKLTFETDEAERMGLQIKGTLILAAGNRFKMTLAANEHGRLIKVVIVSDGKARALQRDGDSEPLEAQHEKHFDFFSGQLARVGLNFCGYMMRNEPPDPAWLKLSGFKTVGKEKVGGREANLIEYQIVVDGDDKNKFICKLWLEVQTSLPVKRSLEWRQGENGAMLVTEIYSQWELDPKLPEATFALPK